MGIYFLKKINSDKDFPNNNNFVRSKTTVQKKELLGTPTKKKHKTQEVINMKYDFSDLTKQLQALNNKLHSQIVNFSGIDEKGMRLDYYNNTYINVDDMNSLQNNVLYITGLPASGKNELAEKLSKEYSIPVQ